MLSVPPQSRRDDGRSAWHCWVPLPWTPHLQGLLCGGPHTGGGGGALGSVHLVLRAAVMGMRQLMLSSRANWPQVAEGGPRGHPQARASAGTQDERVPWCPAQTGGSACSQAAGSLALPTPRPPVCPSSGPAWSGARFPAARLSLPAFHDGLKLPQQGSQSVGLSGDLRLSRDL